MSALPIILCGKSTVIANSVIATLKPEYEVIHVILTSAQGVEQIPSLLRGENPRELDNIGTKNYSRTAIAVITGGGYDDTAVVEMREAAKGRSNVPWLRPDLTKPRPPLGPGYGEALAERVKATLKELTREGKLNEDAVIYY
ncbi:hypothetical protein V1508DRAFT_397941 [Lipomyces doorenjongii]|uniref:uncharacterized protein n=1 Tax=Lipomyces doorenjongii TaxID=383834 RepID=UPI0034CDDC4A